MATRIPVTIPEGGKPVTIEMLRSPWLTVAIGDTDGPPPTPARRSLVAYAAEGRQQPFADSLLTPDETDPAYAPAWLGWALVALAAFAAGCAGAAIGRVLARWLI